MKRIALLLVGLLGAGLVHADTTRISASHAWIRVLPGALPAGAYVVLRNDGDKPVALTGASTPDYGMAMLHRSTQSGGSSRMAMVDALPIPAHGTQALAPGGYHLMLMDARHPVQPGDTVRITLKFDNGVTLPVDFIARPAGALGDQG
ncbi:MULTISPECIES: copper chaperone PCu(A)C [Rhodanobacter]|uniref:Copper chaperone PCu(A)C n=1 Tax=Rhodanobacter hydrolyticus TaxID=2250595 RepID=A0ABW8J6G9_9GAMM|nr:copper chaperone PCu(A)C [Rhodanobacter sp. 7MK24]MBD8879135.1 copper chaperone PCu(A)C [Rhodanobacter sp. 7MK24]